MISNVLALIPTENLQNTEMFLKGGRSVGLTSSAPSVSRLSRQCGILNISKTYRPTQLVTGIALLYGDGMCFL
jgi:hypothetical protein